MRGRSLVSAVVSVAVAVGGIAGAGPALAQYPPGPTTTSTTTTTAPAPTTTAPGGPATTTTVVQTGGTQDAGAVSVGQSFTREVCGFAPGGSLSVSLNAAPVLTKPAGANGCATVSVKVLSSSSVAVDDLNATARCGANTLTVTGPAAQGGTLTQTVTFRVVCAGATRGGVAFTGANVLRWSGIGVALVVLGALVVLAVRRRPAAGT